MAKLIPLDEAAEILGLSADKLLEMRTNSEIFGYRDGATWKFKESEIDRVRRSLGGGITAPNENEDSSVVLKSTTSAATPKIDEDLDDMVDVSELDLDEPATAKAQDDDPDSVLVSEHELGGSDPGASSTIIGKSPLVDADADLKPAADGEAEQPAAPQDSEEMVLNLSDSDDNAELSDIGLAAESGLELSLDDDDSLTLEEPAATATPAESGVLEEMDVDGLVADELAAGGQASLSGSSLNLKGDSNILGGGSELGLAGSSIIPGTSDDDKASEEDSGLDLEGSSLELEGSGLDLEGSSLKLEGSALSLESEAASGISLDADIDGSSLDLSLGSDAGLATSDSGINLGSPSDSGISLEADSSLSLGSASDLGSGIELADDDMLDLGDDEADPAEPTLMGADDDFLLEPVEGDGSEMDSSSQIIALDDEEEVDFGEATMLGEGDFAEDLEEADLEGGLEAEDLGDDDLGAEGFDGADGLDSPAPLAGAAAVPEAGYTIVTVLMLSISTLLLGITGMMMTDLLRNMWSWDSTFSLNSSLMDGILSMFGG